ncbi:MAG: hypothetical protein Q7T22_03195 [Serpentinimonas sp.]|nr:hypothetical protein [Serpentinimonas sp.]MDO9610842.1 hypothetical protein [Serpentinimonas sp.]
METSETHSIFVLRRAWTLGVCLRADIERAFATHKSPAKTSAIMAAAVRRWPAHLHWEKRMGVRPVQSAMTPKPAQAQVVLDLLASGASPQITGVFDDDGVGILRPQPLPSRAMTPAATQMLLQAALREQPVRVLYVGLRKGEQPRWRKLWPSALEYTGLHWRLHAQDMDDSVTAPARDPVGSTTGAPAPPIKVFLLARVLDAQPLSERDAPKGFKRRLLVQTMRRLRVHLSEELTPEQEAVVKNSLDIAPDGSMRWPAYSLYEFKRDYGRTPPSAHVVWPLLSRIDELE